MGCGGAAPKGLRRSTRTWPRMLLHWRRPPMRWSAMPWFLRLGRLRSPASRRCAPLSVVTTLGPPLTIATALMFYFGWARSDTQARYMGLDVSLFGYSTQDYVLRSTKLLFIPLLVILSLALVSSRCITASSGRWVGRRHGEPFEPQGGLPWASASLLLSGLRSWPPGPGLGTAGHSARPGGRHGHRGLRRVAGGCRRRPPRPNHPDVAQTLQSLETVLSELAEAPIVCTSHRRVLPVPEPRIGSGNPLTTAIPGTLWGSANARAGTLAPASDY
jgi:hypothetical protein